MLEGIAGTPADIASSLDDVSTGLEDINTRMGDIYRVIQDRISRSGQRMGSLDMPPIDDDEFRQVVFEV